MTSITHSAPVPSLAHPARPRAGGAAPSPPLNPAFDPSLDLDAGASGADQPTVRALAELFRGLEVVDEALELESGVRIDWVGLDPAGDLLLVLPVSGRGHGSLAAALDAVAFAEEHGDVLRRAYVPAADQARARVRLVVVAESYEPDVERRLGALGACGVELVRLGVLRSARGERLFALSVGGAGRAEPPAAVGTSRVDDVEALLASLPEPTSERVRSVLRRLERLDESLEVRPVRDGLAWYQGPEMLARIELRPDGDAIGIVPGHASRPLGGRQGVELFLDETVAAFVERTAGADGEGAGSDD